MSTMKFYSLSSFLFFHSHPTGNSKNKKGSTRVPRVEIGVPPISLWKFRKAFRRDAEKVTRDAWATLPEFLNSVFIFEQCFSFRIIKFYNLWDGCVPISRSNFLKFEGSVVYGWKLVPILWLLQFAAIWRYRNKLWLLWICLWRVGGVGSKIDV